MFSQTVEYALRAMVCLADPARMPQTNRRIAKITKVPAAYLSKVLQNLRDARLVDAHRGVQGGFLLSRPAEQITILQVVNAVEPIRRIVVCPLGLESHGARLCPLHKKLDQALAHAEAAFGSTTLADLLAQPTASVPLCDFPRATQARQRKDHPSKAKPAKSRRRSAT
jgi:Rrf2 family transcriptional regulator, nitric oxide-sensitive transcriptional repressor